MDNGAQFVGKGGTTEMLKLYAVNCSMMDVSLVVFEVTTQFISPFSILSSTLANQILLSTLSFS